MPRSEWYPELRLAFQYAGGELVQGSLPNAFYEGITEALGDAKVDLIHPAELAGQPGFLFVRGESAAFVRYEEPETQVSFLGSLSGGIYTEQIKFTEEGDEIHLNFEHPRFGPDRVLQASFRKPFKRPGDWPASDETQREIANGQRLHRILAHLSGFEIPENADSAR